MGKAIVRGGGVNGGKGWKGGKGVETPAFSALKAPMEVWEVLLCRLLCRLRGSLYREIAAIP